MLRSSRMFALSRVAWRHHNHNNHTLLLSSSSSSLTSSVPFFFSTKPTTTTTNPSVQRHHFPLVVIGSGGGSKLTREANHYGIPSAMIESGYTAFPNDAAHTTHKHGLGGTCLCRGCIPSKLLIYSGRAIADVQHHANAYNLPVSLNKQQLWESFQDSIKFTQERTEDSSNSVVDVYNRPDTPNHKNLRTLFQGTASFKDEHTIQISSPSSSPSSASSSSVHTEITADVFVVATGSRPLIPVIPGLSESPYLTSTEALLLPKLPQSMIVIGAGYIGTELGHFYANFGTKVTLIARNSAFGSIDSSVYQELKQTMPADCTLLEHTSVLKVEYLNGSFKATCRTLKIRQTWSKHQDTGRLIPTEEHEKDTTFEISAEQLLVCTGTQPNIDVLNLTAANVEHATRDCKGIVVDESLRTSNPRVFAFGDVIDRFNLRHSANFEAEFLLEHVIHGPLMKAYNPQEWGKNHHLQSIVNSYRSSNEKKRGREDIEKEKTRTQHQQRQEQQQQQQQQAFFASKEGYIDISSHKLPALKYPPMPKAMFCSPEVAWVGITEQQAIEFKKEGKLNYVVGIAEFPAAVASEALRVQDGLCKLIIEVPTRRIIGVHIIGYGASILLHQVIPIMSGLMSMNGERGGRLDGLLFPITVHPALNEVVKEAARKAKLEMMELNIDMPLGLKVR